MQRLLEHLKECAFYSTKDLDGISTTLEHMQETLVQGTESHTPDLLTRLKYRMEICHNLLEELYDYLQTIPLQIMPTWDKLVSLLRSAAALTTRSKVRLLRNILLGLH